MSASSPLAIITGRGRLPEILASAVEKSGRDVVLVCFGGFCPDWRSQNHQLIKADFEKPGALFKALKSVGCNEVVFAGSMIRPRLNPLKFDLKMLGLAGKLLPALKSGDGNTLNMLISIFEMEGIHVTGAHEILQDLLAPEGVLAKHRPSKDDLADIKRARDIAYHLGLADVGQGVVVAQGVCLGLESVQGTDALLEFVTETSRNYRPDKTAGQGVLLKRPKPNQDWRVDLPAIGVQTVQNAAKAGLGGIAVQAGGVLILDWEETIQAADKFGLFLYAFDLEKG